MTQRPCEHCKQPFTPNPRVGRERAERQRFCSVACRNVSNGRLKPRRKGQACAHCGRVAYDRKRPICRFCQTSLPPDVLAQYVIEPVRKTWTAEQEEFLRQNYPTQGAHAVAEALGRPIKSVHLKATRLGVNLTKDAMRRIVHSQAQAYMFHNNPMQRPEVVAKVKQWRDDHPEEIERINQALLEGQQRLQRHKISNLELKLQGILDGLNVTYEAAALIKPKFIVDIRIGSLIIQADGDYWHGHPRFNPLTERQRKQQQRDVAQTAYLNACGYTVVRIWESDLNKELVVSILRQHGISTHPDV